MKLYICEDVRVAKWRKYILSDKKLSLVFAIKCICDFIGEKESDIEIVFGKNEYGKPHVESIHKIIEKNREENEKIKMDISLFFSVSHSENMMICAVACFNIGADCQKGSIDNIENCKKIAKRFFSGQENIFLDSLSDDEYINNFFMIWAKKEAYIKYTGKGLAEGMNTFSVADETSQQDYCGEVYFKSIDLTELKKIKNPEKDEFFIYLCYNRENKNIWKIKYFN